jgi:hypothetical protein
LIELTELIELIELRVELGMQDYQNKRKERSDAVSRKIEKLKMRLNRRLVKLAKAMDVPPERTAADAYDRGLGTAALARVAVKQQSRRSSAPAGAAMPMRGGMPPYGTPKAQMKLWRLMSCCVEF